MRGSIVFNNSREKDVEERIEVKQRCFVAMDVKQEIEIQSTFRVAVKSTAEVQLHAGRWKSWM